MRTRKEIEDTFKDLAKGKAWGEQSGMALIAILQVLLDIRDLLALHAPEEKKV